MQRFFKVNCGANTLIGDIISNNSAAQVLILHGAGGSNRLQFCQLRKQFLAEGISSCAFDFVGHGDTGGNLEGSSLHHRTRQAQKIIESQRVESPLCIVAASMGAYTAVKLLAYYEIEKLVLLVPAMYAADANRVPFGKDFTKIIKGPQSWQGSDAWDLLAEFTGRLLIVAGGDDKVIPRGVIDKIYASAVNAEERVLYVAPRASHFLFTDLRSNDSKGFEHVFKLITGMLKKTR
jgi:pimeloyl-ACP methyl ester carboxylesterase